MRGFMQEGKKKIRLSILNRIALLFFAAVIFSALLTMAISYRFMMQDAADQGRTVAGVVATAAKTAIGSREAVYDLMNDAKFRDDIHGTFRYICSQTGVKYLYLYTIDDDGHKHDIVCAAGDEEEDRKMNEEYGFGSVNTRPLYQCEINVLNGDFDEDYQFIDNDFGNVCMYVVPLHDSEEVIALIGVDYPIDSIISIVERNIRILVLIGTFVFIVSYISALLLVRQLVIHPISSLSERMKSFVKDRKEHIQSSKRNTMIEDEITDIEGSFDKMAGDISKYVEDIEHLAGEKAQNQSQLDIARRIQDGIVPKECSLSGNGYEVYGCEHSARDVGGDFYDIFSIDENNIFVVVGDISGKGVSAALFMVLVKTAIKEKLKNGLSLAETLNRVNHEICIRNPGNMFATVFAMRLNTRTGVMHYANAGHDAPILLKAEPSYLNIRSGIALGLFDDSDIVEEEIQLDDGDGILIYTDGITEAIDQHKEQFGCTRLLENVRNCYNSKGGRYPAREIVADIVSCVKEFSKGLEQFDDITCTALVYSRNEEFVITQDIASFRFVKQAIIDSLGNSERTRSMILACEEIFANIVSYSQADNVSFSCERSGKVFSVVFTDNGIPFDPVNADIRKKDFNELDSGGMGIMLARNNSNEMIYNRVDDKNVLVLRFDVRDCGLSPQG